MNIISPSQCRAARALLDDMTRADLAELSGVSVSVIGGFETGNTDPRVGALSTLRLALEASGVEFVDDGVRLRRDHVRTFEGRDVHRLLLDEVYHDLKDAGGGEVLIKGLDESRWNSGDDAAFLKHHVDRLVAAGVTERLLICEDDPVVAVHKHWYKTLPSKYFAPQTQWIFAGKVAMVTWGDIEKVIVIESRALCEAETRSFNCIWDNVARVLE